MVIKQVNATLEERESKKGSKYQVLVIKLTNSYEKLVFLDQAEVELLKMQPPVYSKPSPDMF